MAVLFSYEPIMEFHDGFSFVSAKLYGLIALAVFRLCKTRLCYYWMTVHCFESTELQI